MVLNCLDILSSLQSSLLPFPSLLSLRSWALAWISLLLLLSGTWVHSFFTFSPFSHSSFLALLPLRRAEKPVLPGALLSSALLNYLSFIFLNGSISGGKKVSQWPPFFCDLIGVKFYSSIRDKSLFFHTTSPSAVSFNTAGIKAIRCWNCLACQDSACRNDAKIPRESCYIHAAVDAVGTLPGSPEETGSWAPQLLGVWLVNFQPPPLETCPLARDCQEAGKLAKTSLLASLWTYCCCVTCAPELLWVDWH